MEGKKEDNLDPPSDNSSKDSSLIYLQEVFEAAAEEHVNEINAHGKSPSYAVLRPPPPWPGYEANSPPFYEPCFSAAPTMASPVCNLSRKSPWSTKLVLKENDLVVTVKVITPQGNFDGGATKIPKEEAICRFCFNVYNDNMFQTKCKCKFAMIHRSCEVEWTKKKGHDKCNVCEQDIQNIPIIVSRGHSSRLKRGSTPKRFWSNYTCFRL